MRAIRQLVFPEGLVVLAAMLATGIAALQASVAPAVPTLLFVALGVGALLSLRFHRGRLLLLFIILGGAAALLRYLGPAPAPAGHAAFGLLALLLPLNVAGFALLTERGAFSRPGLRRLGVIAAEALVAALLAWRGAAGLAALLDHPYLPALAGWTAVPQPALAAFALALLLCLALWVREPSAVARGLTWTLVAAFLALHYGAADGTLALLWLATAGFVLTLAVIESSYALAYVDSLTGLASRRAFTEAADRLAGERYTVAMVDVDHFKQCNDRWGHDVGDQVLRMVAARLEQVGGGGVPFRYGGEEFAVIFPGLAVDQAEEHCEALREAVAGSAFAVRHKPRPRRDGEQKRGRGKARAEIAVTISIGLAQGAAPAPVDDVVRAADRALYTAKAAGRNRVAVTAR